MRIEGEELLDAPRERVWAALQDPDVLAGTLPGFEKLERVGENRFAGTLALGVGPVQGRFAGEVALEDLDPPASYHLAMKGQGTPGYVEGGGTIRLEEEGAGTRLSYDFDVQVGGRIAGVGQRVLEMTARMLARHALQNLARAVRDA